MSEQEDVVLELGKATEAFITARDHLLDLCRRITAHEPAAPAPPTAAKPGRRSVGRRGPGKRADKRQARAGIEVRNCGACTHQSFRLCRCPGGPKQNTQVNLKDICTEFMPRLPPPERPARPVRQASGPKARKKRQRVTCGECGKQTAARARGENLLVWKHPAKNGQGICPGSGKPGEPA